MKTLPLWLLALWLAPLSGPAVADEPKDSVPQAYRALMEAQFRAQQEPLPATPEESQKIYENYLQAIGRSTKDEQNDPQDNSSLPPGNPGSPLH